MPTPEGNTLINWTIPEFPHYQRGKLWYTIMGLIALGLIVYGLVSTNFLFAIIILIFSLVVALTSVRPPGELEVRITETGIGLGERFFPYRDLTHFAIIYEPPEVKTLYLELKDSFFAKHVAIPLEDQNPVKLRDHLLASKLREDATHIEEPFTDWLARTLKL